MKKYLCILLTLSIFTCLSFSSSAAEVSLKPQHDITTNVVYSSSADKIAFAEKMDKLHENANPICKNTAETQQLVDSLIEEATFATGSEKDRVLEELATYGVYLYSTTSPSIQARSSNSDVYINIPSVYYNTSGRTWIVTCAGYWKNDNWFNDGSLGYGNMGGEDAFGVGFFNTSGTYDENTIVMSSNAYITDQDRNRTVTTTNRLDGNGSLGVGFRLQDYTYNVYQEGPKYVGYRWYGSCTYNSAFENYNGCAAAYYAHTYKSTVISDINFGITGKTGGVSVTFSSTNNQFLAYSSGDATF